MVGKVQRRMMMRLKRKLGRRRGGKKYTLPGRHEW